MPVASPRRIPPTTRTARDGDGAQAAAQIRAATNPIERCIALIHWRSATRASAPARALPLTSPSGHELGTACVIDRRSRLLHTDQLEALEALARQTVVSLELRRTRAELARLRKAHGGKD